MYEKKRYYANGVGFRIKITQDLRILKRPGKAILYLFTIMLLFIVKDSYGHGKCTTGCFQQNVWRVKFYNELSKGFLHVEGNVVVANYTGDGTLYKISRGLSFYLYDPRAAKFICWNPRKRTTLIPRKYKSHAMRLCEFFEAASEDEYHKGSHVHLTSLRHVKMQFNRNGRFLTRKCPPAPKRTEKIQHRHYKKCLDSSAFLIVPLTNTFSDDECGCSGVENYICNSELKNMRKLRETCSSTRSRSNETYET